MTACAVSIDGMSGLQSPSPLRLRWLRSDVLLRQAASIAALAPRTPGRVPEDAAPVPAGCGKENDHVLSYDSTRAEPESTPRRSAGGLPPPLYFWTSCRAAGRQPPQRTLSAARTARLSPERALAPRVQLRRSRCCAMGRMGSGLAKSRCQPGMAANNTGARPASLRRADSKWPAGARPSIMFLTLQVLTHLYAANCPRVNACSK